MMFKLRKYQQEIIESTRKSFKRGRKRPLIVLPCGAGKTVCFADMANKHILKNKNNYVWFLVHRNELIEQTITVFNNFNISLENIMIAMVQTVTRNLNKYRTPTLIIFDEAHHAKAKTWHNIINHYSNVPMLGLTATPVRLDGKPLGDIFDDLIVGVEADWLINNDYLAHYKYYAPISTDLQFKIKGFDYDLNEFTAHLMKSVIYSNIEKYIDATKKTIIYAPSILFSKALCERIGSTHFDGTTSKTTRKKIIEDFRTGKIKLLSNVNLIGEGFDIPDCERIILLRPTQSLSLFIQQATRGLRPQKNKTAIIYDLVGNVYRHGMPTKYRKWSLSEPKKIKNKSGEDGIITRRCNSCLLVYSGIGKICPYCGNNNGQTKKEIEEIKNLKLAEIKKIERMEVGRTNNLQDLIAIGKKRGYKNPKYWAYMILKSRKNV